MSLFPRMAGAVVAITLAGCTVGPNFHAPAAPTATIVEPKATDQSFAVTEVPIQWWTMFRSPELDRLVAEAVHDNPDLDSVRAAVRVAEENAKAEAGSLLPAISAGYSATRARDATGAVAPTAASGESTYSLHSAQLGLAYTLDLLGGTRRQIEAMHAQANAQRYSAAAAYVGLTANVVSAVISEAALRAQTEATAQAIDSEVEALGVLRRQLAAGQIAELDVIAQEAALGQAQQAMIAQQRQLAVQHNVLIALLGRIDDRDIAVPTLQTLILPAQLPHGVPSQLVARRADIRVAEENLHAASAEIGVARANMLPSFNLTAAWGSAANDPAALFVPATMLWNVTGGVTQPLFQGGALLHKSRAAVANYDQAMGQYRSAVIGAFHEVRDALAGIETNQPALAAAVASERAADETLRIATRQLDVGQISYLALLNAQQSQQQAKAARIQAEAARLLDTVSLYQALGGDWGPMDFKATAQSPS